MPDEAFFSILDALSAKVKSIHLFYKRSEGKFICHSLTLFYKEASMKIFFDGCDCEDESCDGCGCCDDDCIDDCDEEE